MKTEEEIKAKKQEIQDAIIFARTRDEQEKETSKLALLLWVLEDL